MRNPSSFLLLLISSLQFIELIFSEPPTTLAIEHVKYQELIQSYKQDACITHWETGDEMKAYLLDPKNKNQCIVTLTGATWDGHFKKYLQIGLFKRLASLFCDHPWIDFGLFFYQSEKLPHFPKKPNSDQVVWQSSDPSYAVYFFRNGSHFIDNRDIQTGLRGLRDWNAVFEDDLKRKVLEYCGLSQPAIGNQFLEEQEEDL
jgi:hypothetical protein